MMGGTRFIGVYLARQLVREGHDVTLFTRGKAPVTSQLAGESDADYAAFKSSVKHVKGDRMDFDAVRSTLKGSGFQAVYDVNGREGAEVAPIVDALKGDSLEQYIYCSSAGVYLKSDQMPHREEDATDVKSRHKVRACVRAGGFSAKNGRPMLLCAGVCFLAPRSIDRSRPPPQPPPPKKKRNKKTKQKTKRQGKLDTESFLAQSGVAWTSIRPVYIYGPLNYNPVEEWFFHRLAQGRPIPVPGSGKQVTQLGHVADLADAFARCLGNKAADNQVFNVSGERFVTFDGLAKACAQAAGKPEPELVHYDPKAFDFGKAKAFPFRDQHFFASVDKAERVLGWRPKFGLLDGLKDSYSKDFGLGKFRKAADFTTDDMILAKAKVLAKV